MTNWAQDNFAREASIKAAKPKPPPTQAQLERIDSMIDHPAFDHHMDSLTRRVDSMLKTRGGAGLLIGWMKNEIKKYDEEMAEAAAQAKAVAQAQFANLIAATGAPPPPPPIALTRSWSTCSTGRATQSSSAETAPTGPTTPPRKKTANDRANH